MEKKNDGRSLLMLVLSMFIFGTIGIFRRFIPLPSSVIALARGLIGALAIGLLMLLRRQKFARDAVRGQLGRLVLSGALLGINWILLFESYQYTSVAVATLCYYMAPILVILVSPLALRERLTLRKLCFVLLALIGMLLVSGVLRAEGGGDYRGVLFGLGAAAFYACVVLLNKRIVGVPSYDKTVVQLFTAAIVLVPYVLLTENITAMEWTPFSALMLVTVGILHTAVTYALYFGSMDGLRAQTVALFSYIDPIVAILLSAFFLREPMTALQIVGTVLVLFATIGSELLGEERRSKQKEK